MLDQKPKTRGWIARLIILVYVLCLLVGTSTHAYQIWVGGWLPYKTVPAPVNIYWTLLVIADFIAVVFLFWRPRVGIVFTVLIMISDVIINSYVLYGLKLGSLPWLELQSLFLGFVVGSAAFVWLEIKHAWSIQSASR
ncbi:MAG: hypothetical protein ACRER7_00780 [Gammaproteobacteria bacterium]